MARPRAAVASTPEKSAAPSTPSAVHLHQADGLDLMVSGDGAFVTATLDRLLNALGIVAPPQP